MPGQRFVERLLEQVGYEFAASHQYIANAVFYDSHTLPRLAAFFYQQAVEERNHAMMMLQYLLDTDAEIVVPGVESPVSGFESIAAPVELALAQEKRVSEQIVALAVVAREEGDYISEQFLQWFLKEQVEEVSSMSSLLAVVKRSEQAPQFIEDYLTREQGGEAADPTAPPAAGGAL